MNEELTDHQQRLEKFLQHLEEARKLQDDIFNYGLDAAYLYVEDVDGDWLEKWGEEDDEQQQKILESITAFLQSDDWVAIRIRKQLKEKGTSLPDLASKLEKCLCIAEPHERVFEVKKVFAATLTGGKASLNDRNEYSEFDLLDLAEEMLEKLAKVLDNVSESAFSWKYGSN
ncbi:hypothetical protein NUACC21_66780 [Scytonema sp. NUACC21]